MYNYDFKSFDLKIINVGIDLATRISGISISDEEYKKHWLTTIENPQWKNDNWEIALNNFYTKIIKNIKDFIEKFNLNENKDSTKIINVGIELIKKSDDNSQKFHFYAGMIYTLLKTTLFFKLNGWKINVRLISPNEWFSYLLKKIGIENKNNFERTERKKLALEFAKKMTNKTDLSEDEADAFCINYFQSFCRCNSEIEIEVREFKSSKNLANKLKRQKMLKLQKRIDTLSKWLSEWKLKYTLKKVSGKSQEKFDNWLKEFEALKEELNELKKRKKENQ